METISEAEIRVNEHVKLCNEKLCEGHGIAPLFLTNYKVGDLVTTINAYPRNIIGTVFGLIHSPFTNSYRVVLGVNCDVEIDAIRPADSIENITFNLYTKDFNYVEQRLTCLYK